MSRVRTCIVPALVGAVLVLLATTVLAAQRLDDSLSPRRQVVMQPRWAYLGGDRLTEEQLNALVAELRGYEVRLNTAPYVGRDAEIFLVLPFTVPGVRTPSAVRLDWRTRGTFAAGSARLGDRSLVYRGRIAQPVMTEVFDLTLHMDARFIDGPFRFDPVFEIELVR